MEEEPRGIYTKEIKLKVSPKQYRFLQEQSALKQKPMTRIIRELIEKERTLKK